jgi:hypothetical protein
MQKIIRSMTKWISADDAEAVTELFGNLPRGRGIQPGRVEGQGPHPGGRLSTSGAADCSQ